MSYTIIDSIAESDPASFQEPAIAAAVPKHLDLTLVFHYKSTRLSFHVQQVVKRMLDISIALTGLIILMPLLALIAVGIKLTSPGPIFYKSLRIGYDYTPFHMLKFRTMEVNADAKRQQLREAANLDGQLFKIKNDPRVTPIGRFLRKFSLDEFPQLINVIRGEMSLVGPRPLPPDESNLFDGPHRLRFNVLPGITGPWQVSGRSNTDFHQLCGLELDFVLNWSLWKDIQLLFATVPAVLVSRGAY